jgi:hypothetical protein
MHQIISRGQPIGLVLHIGESAKSNRHPPPHCKHLFADTFKREPGGEMEGFILVRMRRVVESCEHGDEPGFIVSDKRRGIS